MLSLIAVFMLFIGSFIRFWQFDAYSFTGDEAAHMRKAISFSRGIFDLVHLENPSIAIKNIFYTILQHNHPPLEFLLAVPASVSQDREFYSRLIFILINCLFLFISYPLVSKIINKKVALFFLISLSTSMYAIEVSQIVTHDSLVIIEGVLIAVAIINLLNKTNIKSLNFLLGSLILGLFTSVDFILYLPTILVVIYSLRKSIPKEKIIKSFIVFSLIVSSFYIPYILYAFLPSSPLKAGFNYYIHGKLDAGSLNLNIVSTLNSYYNSFFSKNGVFPIWIFSLFAFIELRKKKKYISYLWFAISTFLIFNMVKFTTANFYMDFYGFFLIMSSEWFVFRKRIGTILFIVTIVFNISGNIGFINGSYKKSFFQEVTLNDSINRVGDIAKKCLSNNETYISSDDPWRTFYYFGRPILPSIEGELLTPEKAIEMYVRGEFRNEVFLIHYNSNKLDDRVKSDIRDLASKEYQFAKQHIFLFKDCITY